jgi:pilus assembly protein CpaB
MRNKSIYLLLACVCGSVAAILASQWLKAQASNQGPGETREIFVAAMAIDVGEKITPEKMQLEQWPADKIPQGSTGELEVLEGKYAKQRFYVGEAIMPVKLMEENWSTVPKGYRVVAMKASDSSIANLIQPGDRVDVMAYFSKSELIPRSVTKTVLMGVRVYALDGDTERRVGEDRPKTLRTIQLLIHEKDAEAWTYANELGNIRLSLGSDSDYSAEDGSNEAGQQFLEWLDEYRKRQEEALAALEAKGTNEEAAPATVEEEGFPMIKMVEGRMMEYWIVPGKLPVLRGEVGKTSSGSAVPSNIQINSNSSLKSAPAPTVDVKLEVEDGLDYLNGDESPFFQNSEQPGLNPATN